MDSQDAQGGGLPASMLSGLAAGQVSMEALRDQQERGICMGCRVQGEEVGEQDGRPIWKCPQCGLVWPGAPR